MQPVHAVDVTEVPLSRKLSNFTRRCLRAEERLPSVLLIALCVVLVGEEIAIGVMLKRHLGEFNAAWGQDIAEQREVASAHQETLKVHTTMLQRANERIVGAAETTAALRQENADLARRLATLEFGRGSRVQIASAGTATGKASKKRFKKRRFRK